MKVIVDLLKKMLSSALFTIALFLFLGLVYSFAVWNWSIFEIVKDAQFGAIIRMSFITMLLTQYVIEWFIEGLNKGK